MQADGGGLRWGFRRRNAP